MVLMRYLRIPALGLLVIILLSFCAAAEEGDADLFSTGESKERFAGEISFLIGRAWQKWQDSVLINDVEVEGSHGFLQPGDIGDPVLTASSIMKEFDRSGRSREYVKCVKIVAGAVENGMRSWQRGYSNDNLSFPQGASCTYTLPPCNNVPVTVASGRSLGDRDMTEKALYSYMLYRVPGRGEDILIIFRGSAKAIAESFSKWKNSCSIIGILASGGIAPQPAPMGTGPGPVRGAKGSGGKLVGTYIDSGFMYMKMAEYFENRRSGN
jgi:hypothetical protein